MHELYNVKEMLVKELEEFGRKGDLTKPSLDAINKLAHAAKNVCKVIDYCEQDDYSNAMRGSYRSEGSYRDGSYARGYSRSNEGVKEQLRTLMHNANDERVREELRRMIETF